MSGCMSWMKVVNITGFFALFVIIFLIYMTYNKTNITFVNPIQMSNNNNIKEIDDTKNNEKVKKVKPLFQEFDPLDNLHDGTGTPQSQRINYPINPIIRDVMPAVPNINLISYGQYEADKNIERIINPILPPERSYENSYGIPINIPSRGPTGAYQQVGFLSQTWTDGTPNGENNNNLILPLMGRPIFYGSKNWTYYTFSEKYQTVKMPLVINGKRCDSDTGCPEILQGDKVHVPPYKGHFTVELYDYDKPTYIPYVY
jgi:hypothetical protein